MCNGVWRLEVNLIGYWAQVVEQMKKAKMRRTSVDQGPVCKLGKKESLRRRITLPGSGTLLSQLSNGQSNSDIHADNGLPSQQLELTNSDLDVSVGCSSSFGGSSPPTQASNDFDLQKTRAAITNFHRKISQTMKLIRLEQNAQSENVNEYLESVKLERPKLQQTKSIFERKNQKSTQTIIQLQSKLELYQKRLAGVQLHGVTTSKEVLKNISQGLNEISSSVSDASETVVFKPMELATMFKNKPGSIEGANAGVSDTNKDSVDKDNADDLDMLFSRMKSFPGSRRSIDNSMCNANYVKQDEAERQPCSSPFNAPLGDAVQSDISLCQTLQELQVENNVLRNGIAHLKIKVQLEFVDMKQALEMERDFCDRLEEQISDMTELHQHEISELKQDIFSLQEKLQYTLDNRTRDLHEMLESCLQRVTKAEQQQHQHLNQTEVFENSSFSIAKIINFILAFLLFSLVLLSTLASLVRPFLSTRLRYVLTLCFVISFVLVWRNWDFVSSVVLSPVSSFLVQRSQSTFFNANKTQQLHERDRL